MFRKKNDEQPDYQSFTLFDSKSGLYRESMLAYSADDMLRQIQNLFRDPSQSQNVLVTNPEDFSLFQNGTWSKKTGLITPLGPNHIANLHEIAHSVRLQRPVEASTVGIAPT